MIPAKVAIYAAVTPVDLRRSFDGLSAAARDVLGADPRGGALFLPGGFAHARSPPTTHALTGRRWAARGR